MCSVVTDLFAAQHGVLENLAAVLRRQLESVVDQSVDAVRLSDVCLIQLILVVPARRCSTNTQPLLPLPPPRASAGFWLGSNR